MANPQRRAAIKDFLDTLLQSHLHSNQLEQEDSLIRSRQSAASAQARTQAILARAAQDPDFAERLQAGGMGSVDGINTSMFIPTAEQKLSKAAHAVNAAPDAMHLPGVQGLATEFGSERTPIAQLVAEREGRLRAAATPEKVSEYVAGDANTGGHTQERFVPGDPESLRSMAPIQTSASASQVGSDKGVEAVKAQPGTTAAFLANLKSTGLPLAQQAGRVSGAQAAAEAPYHPEHFEDGQGNMHAVVAGPGGGKEQAMPPGLFKPRAGGVSQPPVSVVQNNAAGNTAEVQGVKILAALRQAGLDKSNDWADPKVTQFMVGSLGSMPSDPAIADINQRANYVQATVLRTLMQGRPSAYLANLYSKHIPSATQSPALLYHQLVRALEENAMARDNLKQTYTNLPEPVGGMSYKDFMTANPEGGGTDDPLKSATEKRSMLLPPVRPR